ncbi:hypothetical protein AGABI1DRAFT_87370 [Agaricus bisporus var. burnettii JB137-S8]|uniref:Phytocyanin domain-containing protein n=1 Tax=Agaricus bisporus var. burnettii (strain JB137-S8 / ATCC MYA-4627 / FGSC 10392) TaxID=597362 RepID=K5WLN6_AGABU|nr:uncharacterized protein AGABI1DRAFT_87370 [Agaricus bisporus var. burnettii JB137-S8]EKM76211.1 hypothetical protein AGABI1DRAFT_87370 [Agaricus bisporus var. burnettii JB137-S8]
MKSAALVALLFGSSYVLAAEYLVGVGKDETTGKKGIGFDPSVIHPLAGDVVTFEFRSGEHSAVQTTFETPCVPLDGGFNSGIFTVEDNISVDAPNLPTARLTINDTSPIWFFDQASRQCQQGAVFAINPTLAQTPAQFKDNAAKSPVAPLTSTDQAPTSTESPSTPAQTSGTGEPNGASRLNIYGVGVGLTGMGLSALITFLL